MNTFISRCVLFILPLVLLYSCKPNWKDTAWDVEEAIPIIKSELNLGNIINDTLLAENSDHSLSLVYNTALYNLNLDSLLKMPDTTVSSSFSALFPYTFSPGQQIYSNTQNTKFNMAGAEISLVEFKKGFLRIKIASTIKERLVLEISIPCAKKNGVVFSASDVIPAATLAGSTLVEAIFQKDYDISGYTLNMKGVNNNTVNTIYYTTTIKVHPDASPVSVLTSDYLHIENSFKEFVPSYVRGYFGTQSSETGVQETAFSLFDIVKSGYIKLDEVKLNLNIKNGVGADGSIKIKDLITENTKTGASVSLNHYLMNSWINVNRAYEDFGSPQPLNYTYKSFAIDKSNSNITNLIEILPNKMKYEVGIKLNAQGNTSAGNDFLYTNHTIETKMNLQFPLKFAMDNITLEDTVRININSEKNRIKSGTFNLIADNKFPFATTLQIYLLNDQNQISDSLLVEGNKTIASASVNSNNEVLAPQNSVVSFILNEDKMQHLVNSKKLLLKAVLNTNSYPQITTIYSNYSLKIKLTGNFKATLGKKG